MATRQASIVSRNLDAGNNPSSGGLLKGIMKPLADLLIPTKRSRARAAKGETFGKAVGNAIGSAVGGTAGKAVGGAVGAAVDNATGQGRSTGGTLADGAAGILGGVANPAGTVVGGIAGAVGSAVGGAVGGVIAGATDHQGTDPVSDMDQAEQQRLQQYLDRESKAYQALSNIQQSGHGIETSIIENLK